MKTRLPQGVQDYIGVECYNKVLIEGKIANLCALFGYERIVTTTIEYMDNFCGQNGSIDSARMFKMTDLDGRLIAMRPDATLQVSRVVANKFADAKLKRLYYIADTFILDSNDYNRELAQVGVELIGSDSIDSDAEIIELAIKACLAVGLKDFQIEIGNINFFYGLLENLGLSSDDKEQLRTYINRKDLIGATVYLSNKNIEKQKIEALNMLPYLFGGVEILEEASKIVDNEMSKLALMRLRETLDRMRECGLEKYITVDLGMVKTNNYYSGLVLRGITKSLGHAIIDGGRYDRLSHNHDIDKPAVGLSIWMKRLLIALDNQGGFEPMPAPDYCVACLDDVSAKAVYLFLEELRAKNLIAIRYFGNEQNAKEYCIQNNIRQLAIFANGKNTTVEV